MKKIILVCLILSIWSCDYSYQKKIGDNYFIRCIEDRERMDIGFGTSDISEGLIEPTVFEVHWNDQYILAKRHPTSLGPRKKTIIEYYIIKKVKFGTAKASKNMFGPLSFNEFEEIKRKLSISEQNMESIVFKDLR